MVLEPLIQLSIRNVLAVEDDPAVAQAVAFVRRGDTCNLTVASSAEEARAAIDSHAGSFDVSITDNNMPGVSGGELVRRVRTNNFSGKIVVLSAHVSPEELAVLPRIRRRTKCSLSPLRFPIFAKRLG